MKLLILLLISLSLAACTSVDQQQLANDNQWYKIGKHDGQAGKLAQSQTQLTELGQISTSQYNDYQQGYSSGIDWYCNPIYNHKIRTLQEFYASICSRVPDSYKYFQHWGVGTGDNM